MQTLSNNPIVRHRTGVNLTLSILSPSCPARRLSGGALNDAEGRLAVEFLVHPDAVRKHQVLYREHLRQWYILSGGYTRAKRSNGQWRLHLVLLVVRHVDVECLWNGHSRLCRDGQVASHGYDEGACRGGYRVNGSRG